MPAANYCLGTQQAFRILLQALSHPGEIYLLSPTDPEQGLSLMLKTLLDREVGFAVIGRNSESFAELVKDLTGARLTDVRTADFVIVTQDSSQGGILEAKRGSLEYPDDGATIIYLVDSLGRDGQLSLRVKLQGPGVPTEIQPIIIGLEKAEIFQLNNVNKEFPLGVDCFLLDRSGWVMGIPRSSRVEVQ